MSMSRFFLGRWFGRKYWASARSAAASASRLLTASQLALSKKVLMSLPGSAGL
jgi:hypothetical protein